MDEERYPLEELAPRVQAYFIRHAARYHLEPGKIEARYILNMGGFVNSSFHVTDGQTSYHLKLADLDEMQQALEQWKTFSHILSEKYHAPRVVDWVSIPETPYAGLLSEYIPGSQADLVRQPEVLSSVLEMLACLHADRDLAAGLAQSYDEVPTCADYFLDVYIDRFDEDLLVVAPALPPFVPLETLNWMMGETRELEALARQSSAFAVPADAPTHGDLWASNILVRETGEWAVIDWDDLALGDPALEYNILLGPLWLQGILSQDEVMALLPGDDRLRERFAVCQRALVLDQVIDTLADWVEAEYAPEYRAQVRAEKEHAHTQALALYRKMYES